MLKDTKASSEQETEVLRGRLLGGGGHQGPDLEGEEGKGLEETGPGRV